MEVLRMLLDGGASMEAKNSVSDRVCMVALKMILQYLIWLLLS